MRNPMKQKIHSKYLWLEFMSLISGDLLLFECLMSSVVQTFYTEIQRFSVHAQRQCDKLYYSYQFNYG